MVGGLAGGLAFLLLLAALVGLLLAVVVGASNRRRELSWSNGAVATPRGGDPAAVGEGARPGGTIDFPPFGAGDSSKGHDVVTGSVGGRPFEAYVYSDEKVARDADGRRILTTEDWQVTKVFLPGPVPTIRMIRDNPLFRLFAQMGASDLIVESHEFNQRWNLWCEDQRIGHAIFAPRTIERFLQPDLASGSFIFEGSVLGVSHHGAKTPDEIEAQAAALYSLVDLIPPFVYEPRDAAPRGA